MHTSKYTRTSRKAIIPVGPSIAYLELTKGQYSLFDRDLAHILSGWNWIANFDAPTQKHYVYRGQWIGNGKIIKVRIHDVILGLSPDGKTVDHKNGNPLDNRKSNLRFADRVDQARNRRIPKNNSSGHKGIRLEKSGRWAVLIGVGGTQKYLGTYSRKEKAVEVRKDAERILHGEFVRR